jgi:hypothetical protein
VAGNDSIFDVEEFSMTRKRNMVIHFMDGTNIAYDFPKQVQDGHSITSRIGKLLEMQYLVIESDGVIQLYPVNNIKSVQVYPIPDKLPDFVIRGAEHVETY